ncbi:hypothetical protein JAAARDRAFT_198697 [Jaapia argillacea MUCL 33604]|uniref:Uncharacterized protein n=1 Tax=Jaapia argillacea MUCL 33604 TaxID=933084 RepID=A0A067PLY6_9AGAM|nr:hypothetical protein JAAARDRAFT_198697 [Jaapia argillacea MUCL 33604]
MGQRHQVFAIARLRRHGATPNTPPAYRCVAAYHHEWCCGRLPARAMHRLINLVKLPSNAEVIQGELRAIDGLYGGWGEAPMIPESPCPFVAAILGLAWSVDLEDVKQPYGSGIGLENDVLPADMGSSNGLNNDGISVIDITDPLAPSYCFVNIGGMDSDRDTPHWAPLTAEEYVRAYYPLPSPHTSPSAMEESVQSTINSLQGEKLIELRHLAEAWPSEYEDILKQREFDDPDLVGEEEWEDVGGSVIPSLVEMTLGPAVKQSLESEDISEIERMSWMPGMPSYIKSTLRGRQPFPGFALSLLGTAMNSDHRVEQGCWDLSDMHLTSDQIVHLVETADRPITSLNLSFNLNVTTSTLRQILTISPSIHRLVLLGCPSLPDADLISLLTSSPHLFSKIDALLHPAFLQINSSPDNPIYPNAFAITIDRETQFPKTWSLPYFTPHLVVQNLTDYLQTITENESLSDTYDDGIAPLAALCGGVRRNGEGWGKRSVIGIPAKVTGWVGEGWVFAFAFSILDTGMSAKGIVGDF